MAEPTTAIETENVVGHQQVVTVGKQLTNWDTVSITETDTTEAGGGSDVTQSTVSVTEEMISIDASGFLGSNNHRGTLPQKGDLITAISSKVDGEDLLPDFSRYKNVRITEAKYDLKKGPGAFSWKARSGVQNRIHGTDESDADGAE